MNNKKYIAAAMAITAIGSLALAIPAFAQTNPPTGQPNAGWQGHAGAPGMNRGTMKPGVFGTVSAVNGTSITVNGRTGFASTSAAVVYTVDASNATVMKAKAASTVSAIAVGDTVFVQGTVTGTNVAATSIFDGVMMRGPGMGKRMGGYGHASSTPPVSPIQGNGEPVVAGTVSAVNGDSLSITNKSNVGYTVDVTNAKIVEGQSSVTIANVKVGDNVVVQGTVNGSSITASSVIDQSVSSSGQPQHMNFFAGIGAFFKHLFGF